MLRAISLRESWMREIRTSGLTRERAPNGPSLLYRIPIVSQSDKQNKLLAGHRSLWGHGIPMHRGRARRRGRFQISEFGFNELATRRGAGAAPTRRAARILARCFVARRSNRIVCWADIVIYCPT